MLVHLKNAQESSMKINRNMMSMLTISCLLAMSLQVQAGEKLIPQKQINSKGYTAKVKGKPYLITKIKNNKTPSKQCSLDVSNLKFLSTMKMPREGATAEISLQAKVGPKGHPYCSGKGEGCTMTVEIPDAAKATIK
jgi:hypothetical protein